ncbi:PREDICTED: taste receptor type 2 member 42-like [Elephantulus edwardii]|uniref:taste receptor type 2 member 42-like n=1 Tax=Elephantulus edwardii TaxID=28737 RepID=UPI0003F0AD4A|nr:PREDICTED: taste receptor type 2 member 42-like [Elephantulus edwardii]
MISDMDKIIVTLAIGEFLIGMLENGFIGLVNCSEWVKNQEISLVDFILTCLAISRILQQLVLLFDTFILVVYPYILASYRLGKIFSSLWRMMNHLTTWLSTCVSIIYFLKIAHFSHSLFLWFKWRTNRVILMVFICSLSLLTFDFLLLETFNDFWLNVYMVDRSNFTFYSGKTKLFYVKSLILLTLTYFVPTVLSLISLLLLFLSLLRHTKNLQLNAMGSSDLCTEAHKRAMKMVLSFLLFITIHSVFTQIGNWMFFELQDHIIVKLTLLALSFFPTGHSFILILGNSKLRQTALRLLCILKPPEKSLYISFIDRLSGILPKRLMKKI